MFWAANQSLHPPSSYSCYRESSSKVSSASPPSPRTRSIGTKLRTLVDGIKKTKNWNNLQKGYITEGQSGDPAKGNDGRQFKAIYVRALTEVYRREWKNAGLRKLVKAYLNINVSFF